MKNPEQKSKDIGEVVLSKLFKLPIDKLREKIKSMTGYNSDVVSIVDNSVVYKTTADNQPKSISMSYYDGLVIDSKGVRIIPEQGPSGVITTFGEHFRF